MDDQGHEFDMRLRGYATTDFANVIVGMVQTIARRWATRQSRTCPPADIVSSTKPTTKPAAAFIEILE